MSKNNLEEPLTKLEFYKFLLNDFAHVKVSISYIKGQMKILVPLTMALLGGIVTIITLMVIG